MKYEQQYAQYKLRYKGNDTRKPPYIATKIIN